MYLIFSIISVRQFLMSNEDFLNKQIKICIVEDDPAFRDTFAALLEKYGNVTQLSDYRSAIQYLKFNRPDMLFIDMELNGEKTGHKIVEFASQKDIHCIVVSGLDDEDIINECINLGAKDYFVKGDELSLIKEIINKYKKTYRKPSNSEFTHTNHPIFKEKLEFLLENAKSNFSVLLTGPTGSGKTFFAKQLHMKSEVVGNFVAVNCSSIPKELFESEMFGHQKGAFSGALSNYDGKFLEAHNGTLYLDEIDSMPLAQQAKLLKVIEDKEFYPIGSNKLQKSNFRLICSAQKDLKKMIENGEFREDLYYRISFIETKIPALADRVCDIVPLLKVMLKGPRRYYFSPDFKSFIESLPWQGNLRELQIFASNIELANESKLTEKLAITILNRKKQEPELLTNFHIEKIKELGLENFIEMIRADAFKRFHSENNSNAEETSKALKVNLQTFYRRWRQYESQA